MSVVGVAGIIERSCVQMLAVVICEPRFSSSGMHVGRFRGLGG